ncbi:MAG: DUF5522 domain-containing protein [Acidimicrobiales bacterium]
MEETDAAHTAALAAGHDGYLDPATGLYVLTDRYLRKRGACCASGCRHCPYGAVSSPASGGQLPIRTIRADDQ